MDRPGLSHNRFEPGVSPKPREHDARFRHRPIKLKEYWQFKNIMIIKSEVERVADSETEQ